MPYICILVDKNKKIDRSEKLFQNYFLYPAQYWEHKNHKFLIDFLYEYNLDDKIKNIFVSLHRL